MYDELSEADIQKMKEEIEHRKVVVRKEALAAVKEAREQGDLSENFEYQAAKREKNRNESRIRYLERMVKTAKVIKDHSKDDEVGLNNTVTVYFEDEDEEETYRIVTTVREDVLHGLISISFSFATISSKAAGVTEKARCLIPACFSTSAVLSSVAITNSIILPSAN